MAWRALTALGLSIRLTKGQEIAYGLLLGKSEPVREKLLIVPGGNARAKARALGSDGLAAIREFVRCGGNYLGICGGAGLALTGENSLGLCSWSRKPYPDRLQHLASGHVLARLAENPLCPQELQGGEISLPIWWPGRFSPSKTHGVDILACASKRDNDFWLGDLALASMPQAIFGIWQEEYGLDLSSNFLTDMPLVISGQFGEGRYLLSYSHLETPASPHANAWLAFLIAELTKISLHTTVIPAWDLDKAQKRWALDENSRPLHEALQITRKLLELGVAQHLFFRRTPWLWGWRTGLPGAALNALHASLVGLLAVKPSAAAQKAWSAMRCDFTRTLELFAQSAEESLLTSRITSVLGGFLPHAIRHRDLKDRQLAIFGCPRNGGGLVGEMLKVTEELIYLSQPDLSPQADPGFDIH
ncbi:MAG: hypothetical protein K6G15_08125 [Desulfovibrio sp.]|nr:hypothetical protein [Desulfovibrio sp.]